MMIFIVFYWQQFDIIIIIIRSFIPQNKNKKFYAKNIMLMIYNQ